MNKYNLAKTTTESAPQRHRCVLTLWLVGNHSNIVRLVGNHGSKASKDDDAGKKAAHGCLYVWKGGYVEMVGG
jgi:hypothetical protein